MAWSGIGAVSPPMRTTRSRVEESGRGSETPDRHRKMGLAMKEERGGKSPESAGVGVGGGGRIVGRGSVVDFSDRFLGDAGVGIVAKALLRSEFGTGVDTFEDGMVDEEWEGIGGEVVVQLNGGLVSHLNLPGNGLRDARLLARFVGASHSLVHLNLEWNALGMDRAGFRALCAAVERSETLEVLVLRNCQIATWCVESLRKALGHSKTLRRVDLRGNPLGRDGVREVVEGLKQCKTLLDLDVVGCGGDAEEELKIAEICARRRRADERGELESGERATWAWMKERVEVSRDSVLALEGSVASADRALREAKSQVEELRLALASTEKERREAEDRASEWKSEKLVAERRLREERLAGEELRGTVRVLEGRLKELEHSGEVERRGLEERLRVSEERREKLEEENGELRGDVMRLERELEEEKGEGDRVRVMCDRLKHEMEEVHEGKVAAETRADAAIAERGRMAKELGSLKAKVVGLEDDVLRVRNTLESTESALTDTKSARDSIARAEKEAKAQLSGLREEKRRLLEEVRGLKAARDTAVEDARRAQAGVDAAVEEATKTAREASNRANDATRERDRVRMQLDSVRDRLRELEDVLEREKRDHDAACDELARSKRHLANTRSHIESKDKEILRLTSEAEAADLDSKRSLRRIQELEAQLAASEAARQKWAIDAQERATEAVRIALERKA